MRTKNDGIGKAGEKRIANFLKERRATNIILNREHNGHPDITFEHAGKTYAAECKSMIPIHSCYVGSVHIRRTEIKHMGEISKDFDIQCLIIEGRTGSKKGNYFMILEWKHVVNEYNVNRPEIMSLSFHTICREGVNLRYYLFHMLRTERETHK